MSTPARDKEHLWYIFKCLFVKRLQNEVSEIGHRCTYDDFFLAKRYFCVMLNLAHVRVILTPLLAVSQNVRRYLPTLVSVFDKLCIERAQPFNFQYFRPQVLRTESALILIATQY